MSVHRGYKWRSYKYIKDQETPRTGGAWDATENYHRTTHRPGLEDVQMQTLQGQHGIQDKER